MDKETSKRHFHILLGVALILCAIVVAYPFFFVREPGSVVVLTDTTSQRGIRQTLLVNLNTASEDELQKLPGIGPVMAGRILEYREANGGFTSVEELLEISGIGEKTFAKLETYVTVDEEEPQ